MSRRLYTCNRKLLKLPGERKLLLATDACKEACGGGGDPDCGGDYLHLLVPFPAPSQRDRRVRLRRDAVPPGTAFVKIDDACYRVIEPDQLLPVNSECGCVAEVDEAGPSCSGTRVARYDYNYKFITQLFGPDAPASGAVTLQYDDNDPLGSANTSYNLAGTLSTANLVRTGQVASIVLRGTYSGTRRTRGPSGDVTIDQAGGELTARVAVSLSEDAEAGPATFSAEFEFITVAAAIFPDGSRGPPPAVVTGDGITSASSSWSGPIRFKNEDGTGVFQASASWPEWLFPGPCADNDGGDNPASADPLSPGAQVPGGAPPSALGAGNESRILADLGINVEGV